MYEMTLEFLVLYSVHKSLNLETNILPIPHTQKTHVKLQKKYLIIISLQFLFGWINKKIKKLKLVKIGP